MNTSRNEVPWGKLLWTHLWSHHMYFFAKKWRILSKLACFAMEGSYWRLKCMLRNNAGLSLRRGRLGVQVVVDNHTIDDSLAAHGWDATKRAQNGQRPISVQRYASRTKRRRRRAAPSALRAAVPMWKDTNVRIQHDPEPLLRMARVHAGVHGGGCTPVVRANEGVDKGEIWMKSHEFARLSFEIRTKFL